MREEILAKSEQWFPLEEGDRAHYKVQFKTANGWCESDEPALKEEMAA